MLGAQVGAVLLQQAGLRVAPLVALEQADLELLAGGGAAQAHVGELVFASGVGLGHGLAVLDAPDALVVVAEQGLQGLQADEEVGGSVQAVVAAHVEVAQVAVQVQAGNEHLALGQHELAQHGLEVQVAGALTPENFQGLHQGFHVHQFQAPDVGAQVAGRVGQGGQEVAAQVGAQVGHAAQRAQHVIGPEHAQAQVGQGAEQGGQLNVLQAHLQLRGVVGAVGRAAHGAAQAQVALQGVDGAVVEPGFAVAQVRYQPKRAAPQRPVAHLVGLNAQHGREHAAGQQRGVAG